MKVINFPRPRPDSGITYIGRPGPFGNPFFMKDESMRKEVVRQFEAWARKNPTLLEKIKSLPEDAVLGCYCAPKLCHGDVIVKLWKEMHDEKTRRHRR